MAVEHIGEAAMQPTFTVHVIVTTINGFVENVRISASEAGYFLL
jgi:hypothetical protein